MDDFQWKHFYALQTFSIRKIYLLLHKFILTASVSGAGSFPDVMRRQSRERFTNLRIQVSENVLCCDFHLTRELSHEHVKVPRCSSRAKRKVSVLLDWCEVV